MDDYNTEKRGSYDFRIDSVDQLYNEADTRDLSVPQLFSKFLKKRVVSSSHRKLVYIMILCVVLVMLKLYFGYYYQQGVFLEGSFLKRDIGLDQTVYTGKHDEGRIDVIVRDLTNDQMLKEVYFKLPNGINRTYQVEVTTGDWNQGKYRVSKNGRVLGEYAYGKDAS